MVNLYPYILAAYGGVREGMRWGKSKHDDPAVIAEAQKDTEVMTRELGIVLFWLGYGLVIAVADGNGWIKAVPGGLVLIMSQALVILAGVHVSHGIHKSVMLKKQKAAGLGKFAVTIDNSEAEITENTEEGIGNSKDTAAEKTEHITADSGAQNGAPAPGVAPTGTLRSTKEFHKQKVLDYLKNADSINSEECRKLTGLSQDQSYRLLSRLEEEGILKAEGATNNRIYKVKKTK
jgi:hypothetical protein